MRCQSGKPNPRDCSSIDGVGGQKLLAIDTTVMARSGAHIFYRKVICGDLMFEAPFDRLPRHCVPVNELEI